jgi:hypothetical protein
MADQSVRHCTVCNDPALCVQHGLFRPIMGRSQPKCVAGTIECPKCGTELARNPKGGRPTRWCCEGCKPAVRLRSRLQSLLRVFEEDRYVDQLNGRHDDLRDEIIADMQRRFDYLAGMPKVGTLAATTWQW